MAARRKVHCETIRSPFSGCAFTASGMEKLVSSIRALFDYPETRIGGLYNLVRKELTDFFSNRMPVAQFRGLVQGHEFNEAMVEECRRLNRAWALTIQAGIGG